MKELKGIDIREVWNFRLSTAVPQIMREVGGNWIVQVWSKSNPDYVPEHTQEEYKTDELGNIMFDDNGDPIVLSTRVIPATGVAEPLEVYDTGIPTEHNDAYDCEKLKKCFEWLYGVRDKYSLDHLELRKPVVNLIEKANLIGDQINGMKQAAIEAGDTVKAKQLHEQLQNHIAEANALITRESTNMHAAIAEAEGRV